MSLENQVELTLYPTNLGYLVRHHKKKNVPVTSCYLILNFIKPFFQEHLDLLEQLLSFGSGM